MFNTLYTFVKEKILPQEYDSLQSAVYHWYNSVGGDAEEAVHSSAMGRKLSQMMIDKGVAEILINTFKDSSFYDSLSDSDKDKWEGMDYSVKMALALGIM